MRRLPTPLARLVLSLSIACTSLATAQPAPRRARAHHARPRVAAPRRVATDACALACPMVFGSASPGGFSCAPGRGRAAGHCVCTPRSVEGTGAQCRTGTCSPLATHWERAMARCAERLSCDEVHLSLTVDEGPLGTCTAREAAISAGEAATRR